MLHSDSSPKNVIAPATFRADQNLAGARQVCDTSRRLRLARANRQRAGLGTAFCALVLVAMLAWGLGRWRAREATWNVARWQNLTFSPAFWSESGRFALASEGGLWRVETNENGVSARQIWLGEFPARVAPVEFEEASVVVASLDGSVALLDENGALQWRHSLESAISTRPVVWKNLVVAACDDGTIVAWNRAGAEIWRASIAGSPGEALSVADALVVVPMLGGNGGRGGLTALDGASGKVVWRFPARVRDHAAGTTAPFFDAKGGRIFWANDEGAILCLEAQRGRKIWKSFAHPLPGAPKSQAVVLRGAPVLAGHTLVVGGNDGGVRAFDANDGKARWTAQLREPILRPALAFARGNQAFWLVDGAQTALLSANGQILRRGKAGHLTWKNGVLTRCNENRWELLTP